MEKPKWHVRQYYPSEYCQMEDFLNMIDWESHMVVEMKLIDFCYHIVIAPIETEFLLPHPDGQTEQNTCK